MQETSKKQVWSLGQEDPLEEENGNPLQYSCLKNPMERGAWRATVHRVWKSWTHLSNYACKEKPRNHDFHFLFNIWALVDTPAVSWKLGNNALFLGEDLNFFPPQCDDASWFKHCPWCWFPPCSSQTGPKNPGLGHKTWTHSFSKHFEASFQL